MDDFEAGNRVAYLEGRLEQRLEALKARVKRLEDGQKPPLTAGECVLAILALYQPGGALTLFECGDRLNQIKDLCDRVDLDYLGGMPNRVNRGDVQSPD